ncbi:hypothetical protein NDU88_001575 [Pleurodeles waltl]|uniref:Uncharacterized protein n=1 Tax=Pleurodeles waltl TaxID=8319 RepID=A0AAV7MK57_PLEWA|nr:hypothetical protein NDU88_001575 [Pleurodeles waltl]
MQCSPAHQALQKVPLPADKVSMASNSKDSLRDRSQDIWAPLPRLQLCRVSKVLAAWLVQLAPLGPPQALQIVLWERVASATEQQQFLNPP